MCYCSQKLISSKKYINVNYFAKIPGVENIFELNSHSKFFKQGCFTLKFSTEIVSFPRNIHNCVVFNLLHCQQE